MLNTQLKYGMDVGDQLIAVENAIGSIEFAMEELQGIGEFSDMFEALNDTLEEAEKKKDELESYMSGEYQEQIAEQYREYYRSVI